MFGVRAINDQNTIVHKSFNSDTWNMWVNPHHGIVAGSASKQSVKKDRWWFYTQMYACERFGFELTFGKDGNGINHSCSNERMMSYVLICCRVIWWRMKNGNRSFSVSMINEIIICTSVLFEWVAARGVNQEVWRVWR